MNAEIYMSMTSNNRQGRLGTVRVIACTGESKVQKRRGFLTSAGRRARKSNCKSGELGRTIITEITGRTMVLTRCREGSEGAVILLQGHRLFLEYRRRWCCYHCQLFAPETWRVLSCCLLGARCHGRQGARSWSKCSSTFSIASKLYTFTFVGVERAVRDSWPLRLGIFSKLLCCFSFGTPLPDRRLSKAGLIIISLNLFCARMDRISDHRLADLCRGILRQCKGQTTGCNYQTLLESRHSRAY